MEDQPEYRQPHSHEQTEPALSFDWGKAEQTVFRRFVCRNPLNLIRLISHIVTTSLVSIIIFSFPNCFYYMTSV